MTKPVTAVAVLMLVESGDVALDDPVSRFIPSFADVKVYTPDGPRPPARAITIEDLLTHTSGLTYGLFGDSPVDALYNEADLTSQVPGRNLERTIDELATLPLLTDPGQAWIYSMSLDVLGRVVEVASHLSRPDHRRRMLPEEETWWGASSTKVSGSVRVTERRAMPPWPRNHRAPSGAALRV